jgi:hypothetical protein
MKRLLILCLLLITTNASAIQTFKSERQTDYFNFKAKCSAIKSDWNKQGSLIFTEYKFIDEETGEEVSIKKLGGKVGDIELVVPDLPNFEVGDAYLLSLSRNEENSELILEDLEPLNTTNIQPRNITALPVSGTFVFARWENIPVDFRIDPGTLGGGNGMTIIQQACSIWNSINKAPDICGSLTTGATDITGSNFDSIARPDDGINDIIFDEDGSIISSMGADPDITLGIGGFFQATTSGEILDGFIVLNGTTPQGDFLATAIHELGHAWGIGHTAVGMINDFFSDQGLDPIDIARLPTMYPLSNPLDDTFGRTLEPDDIAAFITLYGTAQ